MKVSIFVINLEGEIFEFDNTQKCTLNIANRFKSIMYRGKDIGEFDVIYFTPKGDSMVTVHNSKTEEESHFIIKAIIKKLKEKSDLFLQRKAIKKIEGLDENILDNIEKDIRNNYFEVKISDILNCFYNISK